MDKNTFCRLSLSVSSGEAVCFSFTGSLLNLGEKTALKSNSITSPTAVQGKLDCLPMLTSSAVWQVEGEKWPCH